jgi:hypothetical protein
MLICAQRAWYGLCSGEWSRREWAQGGDMTLTAIDPPRAGMRGAGPAWCEECGYSLRGLPEASACPECGHFSERVELHTSPFAAWARGVLAGLLLLLYPTIAAIGVVLIQPSNKEIGGLVPALNMPGPKLWAVPLLQRPIGGRPEEPGIMGVRVGIASLIAIWLITSPSALPRLAKIQTLRRATRWGCVVLFGLAWGAMTSMQEIWSNLPRYRLMLLGGVELPGALLLYLYLRAVAGQIPGAARRELFDRLAMFVPITLAGGAVLLALQVLQEGDGRSANIFISDRTALLATGVYGVAAMICAAAATGAVGSLAAALLPLAFPSVARSTTPARLFTRHIAAQLKDWPWRPISFAAGCGLLILLIVLGNERVMWIATGPRIGGTLPYANFPGPKLWLCTLLTQHGYHPTLVNATRFIVINLVAAWLLTVRLREHSPSNWLRTLVRWSAFIAVGGILAVREVCQPQYLSRNNAGRFGIEVYSVFMVAVELPLTLLIYWLMARTAHEIGQRALARQFYALGIAVTVLVSAAVLTFVASLRFNASNESTASLIATAISGSVALATAAWATRLVLALAREVLARKTAPQALQSFALPKDA